MVTVFFFFIDWDGAVSLLELLLLFFLLEELVLYVGSVPCFLYSRANRVLTLNFVIPTNNKRKEVKIFTRIINHEVNRGTNSFFTIIGHNFKSTPKVIGWGLALN